mmetsp:Transcript_53110/g.129726  ORF Transcript_53110/g.129726 Transcript_53110/m.129726 type:complete len:352 (+) Transcript_53110:330-1385(+)|eukprot:CAMPEP_0206213898 /NCGR_PEP_ID=MMETSP0047_2-20121206/1370_1 /ASSEMBLY_ACC=CAM_ASM_000192 /TAXON_ID=195065 /ORGANISM="Chroomonas mesostigmatica_cf, Strain CCMP1168" /LENGTH=351 /DNA_ID=CAMNT_0053636083 /DNA_START=330 /DNA_END=1388 /DNA_ORIENTATION=-
MAEGPREPLWAASPHNENDVDMADSDEAAARHADEDHRANIFDFFRTHSAYDVLPESGKVLLLDSAISAYSAFCIMASNEQLAVPVWHSRGDQYVGMLTVTDILELVLICHQSKMYDSCAEGLKAMTLHHWFSNYARPSGCPDVSVEVRPDDDLMMVLRALVHNDCRVLPVLEREGGELMNHCLIGQVSYLLLFRFLYYHQESDLVTLNETLGDVGIGMCGAGKVITVNSRAPLSEALTLMSTNGISGLPVLDDGGMLVDIFTDSDILSLTHFALDIDVAAALGQARRGKVVDTANISCRSDESLSTIVTRFSGNKCTRLACVNTEGKVEGVVTLTDLFKFLATAISDLLE